MERMWKAGDVIEADGTVPAFLVEADPRVDRVRGCVAIQRGPIVYCLEEHDQQPGVNLLDVKIDWSETLNGHWQSDLLGGVMIREGIGYLQDRSAWVENRLCRPLNLESEDRHADSKVKLTASPYYAWGNRGLKSMRIWIPYAQRS